MMLSQLQARLLLQAYQFIDTLSMQQYIYLIKLANVQAAGSSYVLRVRGATQILVADDISALWKNFSRRTGSSLGVKRVS